MKPNTRLNALGAAMAVLFGAPAMAAEPAATAAFSGEVTPKLIYFDYFKGADARSTQFLERYNVQKGSDTRSGLYADIDLSIVGRNAERETFRLERQGFGAYNHRGTLKADSGTLGLKGYYTDFRSATGGLGFLYSPNQVPGGTDPTYNIPANTSSGFVARFNDDSGGQRLYHIDRTTYGVGLALKPELLGKSVSAIVNYDGYKRDGNRFATFVAGGSDVTGTSARVLQRWRGFDMPVDERMNRYTVNLTGAPGGFVISYDGTVEKFENKARDYSMADITPLMGGFGVASNKAVHFTPDSTLVSNNLRLAKNYGATAVAVGYGLSVLEQDSFSRQQQTTGYTSGKITTHSAYVNINSNLASGVGVEGFAKYNNRENDSTFPAVGLLNASAGEQLGVRIDRIKALSYGLAATFRATALKSTMTAGWKREDKDRDLTWPAVSLVAPVLNGIAAQRSLYRNSTKSDEIYLKLVARPVNGMMLRITPFYQRASETGLVTEPEKTTGLKTRLSYPVAANSLLSAYYDYKHVENANNALSGNAALSLVPTGTLTQDIDKTLQTAGIALSMKPSEWVNTNVSLSWHSDDFSTYFFRADRRRFEPPTSALNILAADRPSYNVDTYIFALGGDWQVNDAMRWNGGYTYSHSKGDTATGYVGTALTATAGSVDGRVDNSVHSLAIGLDYVLSKTMKIKAAYSYDYYDDKVYRALTGGVNGLMVGISLGF